MNRKMRGKGLLVTTGLVVFLINSIMPALTHTYTHTLTHPHISVLYLQCHDRLVIHQQRLSAGSWRSLDECVLRFASVISRPRGNYRQGLVEFVLNCA